jgi:tripartite ATP-independent transporter DctM subunit
MSPGAEGGPVVATLNGASASPHLVKRFEAVLALITDGSAAAILLAEIVILSAGVTARYVFNRPLVWSDELSITLFLWLAMLGSVIAVRLSQHMRLTFLIARLSDASRARVETLTTVLVIGFLLQILMPAISYTRERASIISEGLHIPLSVISAAVPTGIVLMIAVLLVQITERSSVRDIAGAILGIAIVATVLYFLTPQLEAIGNYNLIVFFVLFVVAFVLIGMPIAFAFGVATFSYLSLITEAPLTIVVNRMCEGMSDIILLSIPLFIFLGFLMELAGLARRLIEFLVAVIGHVRDGLSYVLLGGMYLVSGISGSKAADMAAIIPVLAPEMKRRKVSEGDIVSLLSASGAMAETIPPSIILISIGVVTGVSIANLFTGGLVPAAVGALALMVVIFVRSRLQSAPVSIRAPLSEIRRTGLIAIPAIILPFLIRGAVANGIATATEVATVGVVYSMICGIFIYRNFPWRRLYPTLVATASLAGCILLIIGMATAMAWALTQSGFSNQLAETAAQMPGGKFGFMAMSIVLFAVLGSVLEGFPAIVLFGPLLFPIARDLGIHEVQYTMVVVLAMSLGLFSPPLGIGYYSACAIAQVSPDKAMGSIWTYMVALLVAVIIVAAVPWLSIGFLP